MGCVEVVRTRAGGGRGIVYSGHRRMLSKSSLARWPRVAFRYLRASVRDRSAGAGLGPVGGLGL